MAKLTIDVTLQYEQLLNNKIGGAKMIDTIKIQLETTELINLSCLDVKDIYTTDLGDKVIRGKLESMLVDIRTKDEFSKVSMKGSISKYYFGNNLKAMNFYDFKNAISKLSDTLGISLEDASVGRLDISVVIRTEYSPSEYIKRVVNKQYSTSSKQLSIVETGNNPSILVGSGINKLLMYDKLEEIKENDRKLYIRKMNMCEAVYQLDEEEDEFGEITVDDTEKKKYHTKPHLLRIEFIYDNCWNNHKLKRLLGYKRRLLVSHLLKKKTFIQLIEGFQSEFNKIDFVPIHEGELPVVPVIKNKTQLYEEFIAPLLYQLHPDLLKAINSKIKEEYRNKIIGKKQYYNLKNQLKKATVVILGNRHDIKNELEKRIILKCMFLNTMLRTNEYGYYKYHSDLSDKRKNKVNSTVKGEILV
jgi:Phage replication protein CRI